MADRNPNRIVGIEMTERKWTPGPWEVCHMDNWCCVDQAEWGVTVAEIGENDDIGLSNASLIAAAPDMYEALENACRKLRSYVGVCTGDKELVGSIIPAINDALAKARGET